MQGERGVLGKMTCNRCRLDWHSHGSKHVNKICPCKCHGDRT